jgi:hypothetical protein
VSGLGGNDHSDDDGNVSNRLVCSQVVRATGRQNAGSTPTATPGSETQASAAGRQPNTANAEGRTPERTEAISAAGPLHPLLEGTLQRVDAWRHGWPR